MSKLSLLQSINLLAVEYWGDTLFELISIIVLVAVAIILILCIVISLLKKIFTRKNKKAVISELSSNNQVEDNVIKEGEEVIEDVQLAVAKTASIVTEQSQQVVSKSDEMDTSINDEEDDDDEVEQSEMFDTVTNRTILIRYTKSFTAKLIQSENNVQDYYDEIKNHLLSFKKVKSRLSWNFDSFNLGREKLAKISIRGKTLNIYLALNPTEYIDSKYNFIDVGDKKRYALVPMQIRVKSDRALKYTLELIDILLQNNEPQQIEKVDYHQPYDTLTNLIDRKLVKVINLNGETKGTVVVAGFGVKIQKKVSAKEVKNVISDSVATTQVVIEKKQKSYVVSQAIINIDTINGKFNEGATVDLDSLKKLKLIPNKTTYIKVLARGVLDKSLIVKADSFSIDAMKMIIVTGGQVVKTEE